MIRATTSILLTTAFFASGCGGAPVAPVIPLASGADQCLAQYGDDIGPPSVDLNGRWLLREEQRSMTDAPMVGEVVTTTRFWILADIAQTDEALNITMEMCHIDTESSNDSATSSLSRQFVETMGTIDVPATFLRVDSTHVLYQAPDLRIRGADRAVIGYDPLPEDDDDPRVQDDDQDGNPGVTVNVSGMVDGQIYIVQRRETSLCGAGDEDGIEGLITWQIDQTTVGASSFMLNRQTELVPVPDPTVHRFWLSRLPNETTCAEIYSEASEPGASVE
ncbi:MAG: hypothetical protein KC561_05905 [Myxococcales bacterium]|nr:hypothetical protein [Myxococcales bacterium]